MSRTREIDRLLEELALAEQRLEGKRAELERVGHRPAAASSAEAELGDLEAAVARLRGELGEHAPARGATAVDAATAPGASAVETPSESTPDAATQAAPERPQLALSIAMSSTSLPEGSTIRLETTLINRSGRALTLIGDDDVHAWTYRFGSGWEAEFSGLPPAPPRPRTLDADAQRTWRAALERHVRFRHAGGQVRRHLPPGSYELTVSMDFHASPQLADAFEGHVASQPVAFSITPRAGVPFERPRVSLGPGAPNAFQQDREQLTVLSATVGSEPRVLPFIVHQVRRMVAFGTLLDAPPREILETAWLGADAGAACFGGLHESGGRRDARLGGREVSFAVPTWPAGGRDLLWLHAFELAEISRNNAALAILRDVPLAELTGTGAPTPRMRYATALRAVARRESARDAIQALAAVPGEDAALGQARASVLMALEDEDLPALDNGLLELLTNFRTVHYQSDATPSPDALICFEAMALARQAEARGLPVGIVSEFMPTRLLVRNE